MFIYDANGNLITDTMGTGTALTKYYYDTNGNITEKNTMIIASTGGEKVAIGAFTPTSSNIAMYEYNGFNQLVLTEENGKSKIVMFTYYLGWLKK